MEIIFTISVVAVPQPGYFLAFFCLDIMQSTQLSRASMLRIWKVHLITWIGCHKTVVSHYNGYASILSFVVSRLLNHFTFAQIAQCLWRQFSIRVAYGNSLRSSPTTTRRSYILFCNHLDLRLI